MNEDIQTALRTAVGGAPPVEFTAADVIRAGRARRVRRRAAGVAAGALALAATATAVVVGLPAAPHAGTPAAGPRPSAAPAGTTRAELALRFDRAVRSAVPGNVSLVPREVTWLERVPGADGVAAMWRATYFIGSVDGPNFNVAAFEPVTTGHDTCATQTTAISCHESVAPDGSRLVTSTTPAGSGGNGEQLLHAVLNLRPGGADVGAFVIAPRSARSPLSDAQLARVATDPAIAYQRPSDVGPPPARR